MTPQLQQAIRLLQLPSLDLQAHVRETLETNIMLESDAEDEGLETPLEALREREAAAPAEEKYAELDVSTAVAEPSGEPEVEIADESWEAAVGAAGRRPLAGG